MPLDVVHVTRATSAGVRRHLLDLIEGLQRRGVRQGLCYDPVEADAAFWSGLRRLRTLGVEAVAVPMVRPIRPVADLRTLVRLWSQWRAWRAPIVHLHSSKAGALGRVMACFEPSVRVVYSPHASAAHLSPIYGAVERLLGHVRTDRLIAVSASEADECRANSLAPSSAVRAVSCGINLEDVRVAAAGDDALPDNRPSWFDDPQTPMLVASGRLVHQKDPMLLVQAFVRLSSSYPDLRVVWVGDGPLRLAVEEQLAAHGLENRWWITGWLENPFPVMARGRCFVLPSRYESFGYVTLEAMALGVPVIATNVTGSRDLIADRLSGWLVPVGDVLALEEACCAALAMSVSDQQAMQIEASRRAALFSHERMVSGMLDVYAELGLRTLDEYAWPREDGADVGGQSTACAA